MVVENSLHQARETFQMRFSFDVYPWVTTT